MQLEVAGKVYSDWISASVTDRFDALTKKFTFGATSSEGVPLPFTGGEDVTIKVDGERVVTGFIERVRVDGGPEKHNIVVEGRGRTLDLSDSAINQLSDLSSEITLKELAEAVIKHIGSGISVVDTVSPPAFTRAVDNFAPEQAENCFEFLERFARKREVLLGETPFGNLLIHRGGGVTVEKFVRMHIDGDRFANNVESYHVSYDGTNRFNKYVIGSQLNLLALGVAEETPVGDIVEQCAEVTDSFARKGRQMVITSESFTAGTENEERAVWERNIRRARSRVYGCTVQGYRGQDGNLWRTGELVQVHNEFAGINKRMLCNEVTFTLDADGGRLTTLAFVEQGAYLLELQEPQEDTGLNFAFLDPAPENA